MNCAAAWRVVPEVGQLYVYASSHAVGSIPLLNGVHFEETGGKGLSNPVLTCCVMAGESVIELPSGAKIISFPVHHGFGKVDALAFRVTLPDGRVIAYSGDTGWCDELIAAARDADIFICEASAPLGNEEMATKYGHLNPRQAGEAADRCGAKKLVLTHYSGRDSDEAMLADCRKSGFTGEIVIAKDGDRYEIS